MDIIEIAKEYAVAQQVAELETAYYTFTEPDLREFAQRIEQPHKQRIVELEQAPAIEPAQSGWLRAIDEALVCHHIDVANADDDYATAKDKLNKLLCVVQDIGAYFAKQKPAQAVQVAWKHDCAALLTNGVELWIDQCPHCGKPRTAHHAPLDSDTRKQLLDEFPLLDDDGLSETEHHCEWVIQQDRKRLNKILKRLEAGE